MKGCVRKWLAEQIGADEDLMERLYSEYARTLEEQLAQSRRNLAGPDFTALDRTAHALKGATLMIGDTEMLEVVLALRDAAKACDFAAATAAADRLEVLRVQL